MDTLAVYLLMLAIAVGYLHRRWSRRWALRPRTDATELREARAAMQRRRAASNGHQPRRPQPRASA